MKIIHPVWVLVIWLLFMGTLVLGDWVIFRDWSFRNKDKQE